MTTIEAIQHDLHYKRTELNKARKAIVQGEVEKLHIQSTINGLLDEIKELKQSLKLAVK